MVIIPRRDVLRSIGAATICSAIPKSGLLSELSQPHTSRKLLSGVQDARALILQEISRGAATGVSVAVVERGSIAWEEGFGLADRDSGVGATAVTPFTLASITKTFTATTFMTLAARGGVDLDAPANEYLPEHQRLRANGAADQATVRLLGAHVSGLPTMWESFDRDAVSQQPDSKSLLKMFGHLAYPPEVCYEYSNIGFSALAAIAENMTGTDFGTLLQTRVLQPLGLRNSFFGATTAPRGAANRYDASGNLLPFYTTSTPASGELYASAHDLALFAMFNMDRYSHSRGQILSSLQIEELHKTVFVGASGVATTFGWFRSHLRSGMPVISKIGGQPGVATAIYMLPGEGFACLVLTNRSNGRDLCNDVCNCVLSSYRRDWQLPEENCTPRATAFVPTATFVGRWIGSLKNGDENIPINLHVKSSGKAYFAVSNQSAYEIGDLRAEGPCLLGNIDSRIGSAVPSDMSFTTSLIKLLPVADTLDGRILVTAGNPSVKNLMLPYVVSLHRK